MERHADTLGYYDANASGYAEFSRPDRAYIKYLDHFCALIPRGARVLDLGCGAGHLGKLLIDRGYDVSLVDGSRGLAAEAGKLTGQPVRVLRFQELDDDAAYDAVWAAASLLHVPGTELPDVLARVNRSLVHGGILYASFKEIDRDLVDTLGRHYSAMTQPALASLLEFAGFKLLEPIDRRPGRGADGLQVNFIHAFAEKVA